MLVGLDCFFGALRDSGSQRSCRNGNAKGRTDCEAAVLKNLVRPSQAFHPFLIQQEGAWPGTKRQVLQPFGHMAIRFSLDAIFFPYPEGGDDDVIPEEPPQEAAGRFITGIFPLAFLPVG